MSEVVIRVENLYKEYRLGTISHGTLYQDLQSWWANLRDKEDPNSLVSSSYSEKATDTNKHFYALKDISFDVKQGEIVGIIGRNGAGKSTLLKIMSKVTAPTRGTIKVKGRIASLLEVGTGFHHELTGRENIYLNGTILGMKRKEIDNKFEEIVNFAEIEEFVDTPVKRYSSGMYVRLAFAVAAHLEPEILLVDEVLAVGDAAFQKKCLGKMGEIAEGGRTVLFVSHNMNAITRLCPRSILLDEASILQEGPSNQVVNVYLKSDIGTTAKREWRDLDKAPGNDIVRLCAVRVRTGDGRITDAVDIRQPVGIEMEYEVLRPGNVLIPNYHLFNEEGIFIFVTSDWDPEWRHRSRPKGRYTSTALIPGNFLSEGTIIIGAAISTLNPVKVHFHEKDAVAFHVIDSLDGDSARGDYAGTIPGVVRPLLQWTTKLSGISNKTSTISRGKI